MLSRAPERSSRKATTLTTRPPVATSSIGPAGTSGGSVNRPTASITTYPATPVSSTALASAASTSSRYSPKVRCESVPARPAAWIAASAIAMPSTSVNMWPASDSRASEPVASAAAASTSMTTASRPAAHHRRVRCRPPACSTDVPWSCPAPMS
jgi:hypothetical protein